MFCPKCGNQVADGSAFCGNCGAAISRPAAPAAAPAATIPQGGVVAAKKPVSKKLVIGIAVAVVIAIVAIVLLVNCLGPKQLQTGVYRLNANGETGTLTVSEGNKVSMTADGKTDQVEFEYAGTWKGSNVFKYAQGTSSDGHTVDKDGWVYDSKGALTGSKLDDMRIALPNGYANGNVTGSWAYAMKMDDGSTHSITGAIADVNKDGTITVYSFYGTNVSLSVEDALNYDYASMTYQQTGSMAGVGTSQTSDGLSVVCMSGVINWQEASDNTYRITYPQTSTKTSSFTVSFPTK